MPAKKKSASKGSMYLSDVNVLPTIPESRAMLDKARKSEQQKPLNPKRVSKTT